MRSSNPIDDYSIRWPSIRSQIPSRDTLLFIGSTFNNEATEGGTPLENPPNSENGIALEDSMTKDPLHSELGSWKPSQRNPLHAIPEVDVKAPNNLISLGDDFPCGWRETDFSMSWADPWDPVQTSEDRATSIMNHEPVSGNSDDSAYFSASLFDSEEGTGWDTTTLIKPPLTGLEAGEATFRPMVIDFSGIIVEEGKEYTPNSSSHTTSVLRSTESTTVITRSDRKKGVRTLTEDGRQHAKLVRRIGACPLCREKKVKCLHVIPSTNSIWTKGKVIAESSMDVHYERQTDRSKNTTRVGELEESKLIRSGSGAPTTDHSPRSRSCYLDQSLGLSPSDFHLVMLQAKHKLTVALMEDVYAIFDSKWKVDLRTCAMNSSDSSGKHATQTKPEASGVHQKGKRRMKDRDSSPPGDGESKRGRRGVSAVGSQSLNRQYACPFHKHDSQKYSTNIETGAKYRACMGPGFGTIARLKQHIRTVHPVPIQCLRCWLVVPNSQELAIHTNQDIRCQRRDPQPEVMNQDKMDLISCRGASWEKIYEIIFPGAPIPSPYFDATVQSNESIARSSPASQELRDFEAYNRTMLPRLVEENLQVIVNTEMAPLEQNIRSQLVDIVRRCLSTLAQNYRATRELNGDVMGFSQPPASQAAPPAHFREHGPSNEDFVSANDTGSNMADFFLEPPHMGSGMSSLYPNLPEGSDCPEPSQDQPIDSGYGSVPDSCDCACHNLTGGDASATGKAFLRLPT